MSTRLRPFGAFRAFAAGLVGSGGEWIYQPILWAEAGGTLVLDSDGNAIALGFRWVLSPRKPSLLQEGGGYIHTETGERINLE